MHINFIFNEIVIKKPREKTKFEMVLPSHRNWRVWGYGNEGPCLEFIHRGWSLGRAEEKRKILCLKLVEIWIKEKGALRRDELGSVSFVLNTRFMWNCERRHDGKPFWCGALSCHWRPNTSQQVSRHSVKLLNWRTNDNLDLLLPSLRKERKEASFVRSHCELNMSSRK